MKADATTETAVMKILEDLGEAFASKDLQRVLGHAAPDADIVMLGSAWSWRCRRSWPQKTDRIKKGGNPDE
jgi:hypothetical protein